MEKIDFVITWVDGSDPAWLEQKSKYSAAKGNDSRNVRYRDWEILKYLFRSIELNASWVNKVYFVTWGHLPSWLNTECPKLEIINHKDFIPEEYLPTFNSCAIELNFHRINNLNNNFVYLNDDTIFIKKTKEEDFFKNGLPCDTAVLNAIIPYGNDNFEHRLVNNSNVINRNFDMMNCIKKNPFKWISFEYGTDLVRTFLLLPWKKFSTIKNYHTAVSLQKENFNTLWEKEEEVMKLSCADKFRSFFGVNPWVIENWQIASGKFYPRSSKFGKMFIIDDNNEKLFKTIKKSKYKCLCINDNAKIKDYERVKKELTKVLEEKFPNKSIFEK